MSKILSIPDNEETPNADVFPLARMINNLMKEEKVSEDVITHFEETFVDRIEQFDYYAIFGLFADQYDLVMAGGKNSTFA